MATRFDWFLLMMVAGLLTTGLVLVSTVLVASRHSLAIWQRIKSAFTVLVWVVPAVAVVGMIGLYSDARLIQHEPNGSPTVVQVAHVHHQNAADHSSVSHQDHSGATAVHSTAAIAQAPGLMVASTVIMPEKVQPRLKVKSFSTDDPKWDSTSNIVNGRELVCLSSQRFATLDEAEAQITSQAVSRVLRHYPNEWRGVVGDKDLEQIVGLIDQQAVKDYVAEIIPEFDFGNGIKGKMYRAHARLDLNGGLQDGLRRFWRDKAVEQRLILLGGLIGLVTLMLGTSASYFRLDDATGGAYRRRLKLAALAVIAAGSLAAVQVIA